MSYEYESVRRVCYDFGEFIGKAVFVPVCEQCGRFVKTDIPVMANEIKGLLPGPTATCSKCGPTTMPFEGFF